MGHGTKTAQRGKPVRCLYGGFPSEGEKVLCGEFHLFRSQKDPYRQADRQNHGETPGPLPKRVGCGAPVGHYIWEGTITRSISWTTPLPRLRSAVVIMALLPMGSVSTISEPSIW